MSSAPSMRTGLSRRSARPREQRCPTGFDPRLGPSTASCVRPSQSQTETPIRRKVLLDSARLSMRRLANRTDLAPAMGRWIVSILGGATVDAFERFDGPAREAFQQSLGLARRLGSATAEPRHILLAVTLTSPIAAGQALGPAVFERVQRTARDVERLTATSKDAIHLSKETKDLVDALRGQAERTGGVVDARVLAVALAPLADRIGTPAWPVGGEVPSRTTD